MGGLVTLDCHHALSALFPLHVERAGWPTPVCGTPAPQGGGLRLGAPPTKSCGLAWTVTQAQGFWTNGLGLLLSVHRGSQRMETRGGLGKVAEGRVLPTLQAFRRR